MPNTRVLVTGSNGFIGSSLVQFLSLHTSFSVFGFSKGPNRLNTNQEVEYFDIDIENHSLVESTIREINPSVIIHCAAISQVDFCEENPLICEAVNVIGTQNLVNISREMGSHFVFLSSDFVFGGEHAFVDESEICNPLSVYGKSKLASESYLKENHLNFAIIRPVLVYGFSASARRGNIFTWVVENIKLGKSISVVTDQYRTPTFVGDLVQLLYQVIENNSTGVFNIGGDNVISVFDFAKEISKGNSHLILPVKSEQLNGAELRPKHSCFKSAKVKLDFNLVPKGIESGIKAAFKQLNEVN